MLAQQPKGLGGLGEDADGFGAAHIDWVGVALPGEDVGDLNRPEFRAASFLVRKDAIMPKHYDAEVKARAVRLVTEHKVESGSVTKSCEAVGRRLGISKETLRGWCRQAQVDAGEREGVSSEELAEIKRLKAENRRLREDVEILRAATTFFAGELDPRNR